MFSVGATLQHLLKFPSVTVSALPISSVETTWHLRVESVERFSGNVTRIRDELDQVAASERVLIACQNDAECKRLTEVLAAGQLALSDRLRLVKGHVHRGYRLVEPGVIVLGSHELFHRDDSAAGGPAIVRPRGGRKIEARAIDSFLELAAGDLVVHVSHGIARFRGMVMLDKASRERERPELCSMVKLQSLTLPARQKKNTSCWNSATASRSTSRCPRSISFRNTSAAARPSQNYPSSAAPAGPARSSESKPRSTIWPPRCSSCRRCGRLKRVFRIRPIPTGKTSSRRAFPYQETPDQLTSLRELKADMQRARPMDRLICGDVGYGKTELAVRAAFKAVDNGKQVAVLVPTTVLAEQHLRTFSQRFAEYPYVVDGVSRFKSHGEQKRILQRVAQGGIDVIIGTHRLVSDDVRFKELGLVIIDEEQRFGVEHKEKLKRLRAMVDVLTLTATPIPRTLHLALLGIRDISNLETPPPDRLPIETRISRFDRPMIRQAILRELNREGQVYFVHNRVHDIHAVAGEVQSIVPDAKIVIASRPTAGR